MKKIYKIVNRYVDLSMIIDVRILSHNISIGCDHETNYDYYAKVIYALHGETEIPFGSFVKYYHWTRYKDIPEEDVPAIKQMEVLNAANEEAEIRKRYDQFLAAWMEYTESHESRRQV